MLKLTQVFVRIHSHIGTIFSPSADNVHQTKFFIDFKQYSYTDIILAKQMQHFWHDQRFSILSILDSQFVKTRYEDHAISEKSGWEWLID